MTIGASPKPPKFEDFIGPLNFGSVLLETNQKQVTEEIAFLNDRYNKMKEEKEVWARMYFDLVQQYEDLISKVKPESKITMNNWLAALEKPYIPPV